MKVVSFLFGLTFLCCQTVDASIITLDGNDIRNTGTFIEGDYMITAPENQVNGGNLALQPHLIAVGFSGDYMETWNTAAVFTLNAVNDDLFEVVGLDVGSFFSSNNALAAWTFKGFNGVDELFSVINKEFLGRIELGWTGLTSFTIQSSRGSAASAFDNIELVKSVQDTSSGVVAEPTSLAFFGLFGFTLLMRTRRSKK